MNFLKKMFGGGKKDDGQGKAASSKEKHENEHTEENKDPNVCEYC